MNPHDQVSQRLRLAAYAWVESGNRVLLSRISPGTPGAGRWTLPGGELHFGEDPSEGVVREIAEETGLDARVGELLAIRSIVLEPEQTVRGDRLHAIGILYRATALDGELRPETDGSSDMAAWVPFAELDDLPAVRLLEWARSVLGR